MEEPYGSKDELRARFTAWLRTLLCRAKIDYIRQVQRQPKTVTLELAESEMLMDEPEIVMPDCFDFDNIKLKKAFAQLSLSKQKLLKLLFVDGLEVDEAAQKMDCTIQNIYNLRSKSLKELREYLMTKDGNNEQ